MNAKNKPLKQHENICIFSKGNTANGSKKNMKYYLNSIQKNTRSLSRDNIVKKNKT